MQSLAAGQPKTPNTRRREFRDPAVAAGPLIIDVRDIDGHEHVDTESFMDTPARVTEWAVKILSLWGGAGSSFVLEVLWENSEPSYHTPLDVSYRQKLVIV